MIIYGLQDPITQQLHYVGATKHTNLSLRLKEHIYRRHGRNPRKYAWVKNLKERGVVPDIFVIEEVTDANWQEAERFWIAYYKSIGADLFNLTDGGEGGDFRTGRKHSLETRAKMSKSKMGLHRGMTYEQIYGVEKAIELRNKRSTAMKGVPKTTAHKAKLAKIRLSKISRKK